MISDEPDFVDREDEERRYRALSLAIQWAKPDAGRSVIAIAEAFAKYLRDGTWSEKW